MQKFLCWLFILLWASTLTGCQTPSCEGEVVTPSPSATAAGLTATPDISPTPTETEEPTSTATATPTFTPTMVQSMDCGEIFCTVQWLGILERPIGYDYRNIIDPSYPYASTRNKTLDPHRGVELINSFGTPVLAAQSGDVVYAGKDDLVLLGPYTAFYGNVIILQHPGLYQDRDVYTLYAHLSAIFVEEGAQVTAGEVIGEVGASGAADGSHLHFEVRLDVNDYAHTTNPVLWFSPVDLAGLGQSSMLAGTILDRGGNPVSEFQLSLEKLDAGGEVETYYYPVTYYPAGVNGHPVLQENFTVPDLPPGDYRLAFIYGKLYEVFFTLEPGELGFIKLQLE